MKMRAECKDRKEFGNIGSARKSLPVGKLNGTSADDLFPLFDRYGKVVDIFIPRDRRTGESRGFAFVRYKHADEAQKAIERLDGRNVDGRDIVVQYAKYGRNDEAIHRGKITQGSPKWRSRSRSRSPRRTSRRYRDDCSEKLFSRRSRSHSQDMSDRGRQRERIRNESYRRGNRSGTQSSVSRSRSRSMSDQQGEHHARSLFEKPSSVRSKSQGSHGCSASPSPSHTRSFSVHSRSSQDGALQVTMNGNPSATELMSTGMELKFPVMSREARPLGACSIGCQSIPLAGRTASPSYDHQSPEQ